MDTSNKENTKFRSNSALISELIFKLKPELRLLRLELNPDGVESEFRKIIISLEFELLSSELSWEREPKLLISKLKNLITELEFKKTYLEKIDLKTIKSISYFDDKLELLMTVSSLRLIPLVSRLILELEQSKEYLILQSVISLKLLKIKLINGLKTKSASLTTKIMSNKMIKDITSKFDLVISKLETNSQQLTEELKSLELELFVVKEELDKDTNLRLLVSENLLLIKELIRSSEDSSSHRQDASSHRQDASSHRQDASSHRQDASTTLFPQGGSIKSPGMSIRLELINKLKLFKLKIIEEIKSLLLHLLIPGELIVSDAESKFNSLISELESGVTKEVKVKLIFLREGLELELNKKSNIISFNQKSEELKLFTSELISLISEFVSRENK